MIRHTPLFRKIVNGLGILSIVLGSITIAGVLFYRQQQWRKIERSCADRFTSEIPGLTIQGRIVEIRRPDNCQTIMVIVQQQPLDTLLLDLCTCPNSTPMADIVVPGDSISKIAGSTMIQLHRPEEAPKSFDFPCCQ